MDINGYSFNSGKKNEIIRNSVMWAISLSLMWLIIDGTILSLSCSPLEMITAFLYFHISAQGRLPLVSEERESEIL